MAEGTKEDPVEYIGEGKDKGYYPRRKLLGSGSLNTEVYQGFFQKKPAAVKRVRKDTAQEFAKREIQILCNDKAPLENVVTCYWASLEDDPRDVYYYLILELCAATLDGFIAGKYSGPMPSDQQVLSQICRGIDSLHLRGIAHKDLRPQNILISMRNDRGQVTMKIADFGLSRQTLDREVTNTNNKGAQGWVAPEIAAETPRVNYLQADIFSLGCVLYYFITRGQHPFGHVNYKRQSNIADGRRTIDPKIIDYASASAVEAMTDHEPAKRPNINQVLLHPFLWPPERTTKFLADTSNYLEPSRKKNAPADLVQLAAAMEVRAQDVTGGDWLQALSPFVQQHVQNYLNQFKLQKKEPDYSTKVLNLLRVIRNLRADGHFHELPGDVQKELGNADYEEFSKYWTRRFPELLLHTYNVMRNCTGGLFREFYQEPDDRSQFGSTPTTDTQQNSVLHDLATNNNNDNSMLTNEIQNIPKMPSQASTSVSTSAEKETVAQRLLRMSFGKTPDRAGSPVSNHPASDDLPKDSSSVSANTSLHEDKSEDNTAPNVTGGEFPGEVTPKVQRKQASADEEVLESAPINEPSRAERVPRMTVLADSYTPTYRGRSSVKRVACNPVYSKQAAVALKDGSVLAYCELKSKPIVIQGSTSSTSALVWNVTGTWLAGDQLGRVFLWDRLTRVYQTAMFPKMQVVSMQWTHLKERDILQIVFQNKFYAMNTDTTRVCEYRFPQNCSMCSDWNGSNLFAVALAKTYAVNLYQVNLDKEQPLTLLATLPGLQASFPVYVSSIRWNPANPNWIAVGYKTGHIRVWNLADASTPILTDVPASFAEVLGLEWMDSGSESPGMLASCSNDNTVRIHAPHQNWECVKTIQFPQYVSKLKYHKLAKSLFISSFNAELRIINAALKDTLIYTNQSPIWDFDLGSEFYVVIGDKIGCVRFHKMEIQF